MPSRSQARRLERGAAAIQHDASAFDRNIDFVARFQVGDLPHLLVCEFKRSGQPRYVREAVHHLKVISGSIPLSTPVFLAPYLSEESRRLCQDAGVGYADLEGNGRLVFDTVFIERRVDSKSPSERRELRSLFKPKSAQVLRRLLREPVRSWKIVDLAHAAEVSLGHASNVRKALIERDWASADTRGLALTEPDALLDQWRDNHGRPRGERIQAYTTFHGRQFTDAVRKAASHPEAHVAYASFSAANWLAPYGRTGIEQLYVDREGLAALSEAMDLSNATEGANLEIIVPRDTGIFLDVTEPAPGVWVTSPVQTYLDLFVSGERGREAAEHLRGRGLKWPP